MLLQYYGRVQSPSLLARAADHAIRQTKYGQGPGLVNVQLKADIIFQADTMHSDQSFSHYPTLIATPAQDHKAYLHASKLFMSPPHSQGRSHLGHYHRQHPLANFTDEEAADEGTLLFCRPCVKLVHREL